MARSHTTFCRFCIANCGLDVTLENDRVVGVVGLAEHPLSRGYTCEKGRHLAAVEHHEHRLLKAQVRSQHATPRAVVDDLARCMLTVRDRLGPDGVGVYQGNAAGFDTTAWAACSWFTRALGTRNRFTSLTLDAVAKPYVAELMSGMPGLVPHPDRDARLVLLLGTNPVVSHGHTVALADPVRRLRSWSHDGELWVIDPRRTETARLATHHVSCRAGTDHLLLAAVLRDLLDGPLNAPANTTGIDQLRGCVADVDDRMLEEECRVDRATVSRLAAAIRRAGPLAVLSGTGSTMSPWSNLNEWLLLSLVVLTGSVEVPGGTWFHPGFFRRPPRPPEASKEQRREPSTSRWHQRAAVDLVREIEDGRLDALVVVGGNPLRALPESERVRSAFERLEVLAVVDVIGSELTRMATHVLPAPTQLERPDVNFLTELAQPVVTGQYTSALRSRPADARSGWWWLAALGDAMGFRVIPDGLDLASTDDAVLGAVAGPEVGRLRDEGAGWQLAEVEPWLASAIADRGWNLAPSELVTEWRSAMDACRSTNRLVAIPARQRRHVNATFMVDGTSAGAVMNPDDANDLGIADGDTIDVDRNGSTVRLSVTLDRAMGRGTLSIANGFDEPSVNALTLQGASNPYTGMPEYTAVPVEVSKSNEGPRVGPP